MGKGFGKKKGNKTNKVDSYLPEVEFFNAGFERYYRLQGVIPQDEFDDFLKTLRTPLPNSFRIVDNSGFQDAIRDRMKFEFSKPGKDDTEDLKGKRPYCITWYPKELGWVSTATKKELKEPALASYRSFLISENDKGNINRQEVVSMIPALFLDVNPSHLVLDMCAAPGSKTAQLLESIQEDSTSASGNGMVVANDVDFNRAFMLVHQTKRLGTPHFAVTTHAAQLFPPLYKTSGQVHNEKLLFDRILADVPCSGDGTMRKQPDLWRRWHAGFGAGLHRLQCCISKRGLQLLKKGGLMVYSTCSLNPHEDEAVVAELLRYGKGKVELVDCSEKMPTLKRCSGISKWWVHDWKGAETDVYSSFEELNKEQKERMRPSLFSPTEDEAKSFHLDRCMRVLPHHQDTGGFFIALLRKTEHFSAREEERSETDVSDASKKTKLNNEDNSNEEIIIAEEKEDLEVETEPRARKNKSKAEDQEDEEKDSFVPMSSVSDIPMENLKKIFGILPTFPFSNVFARSDLAKKLYVLGDQIASLFLNNNTQNGKLKVAHAGVKIFERVGKATENIQDAVYRVCQEGVHLLLPFITKQVVYCNIDSFLTLLSKSSCLQTEFDADLQAQLDNQSLGCLIAVLKGDVAKLFSRPVAVAAWKTNVGLNVMVSKVEVQALLNSLSPSKSQEIQENQEKETVLDDA